VVTPAYNEMDNLPVLYERLIQVLESLDFEWEWIIVDDHSNDATFSIIAGIAGKDPRVRGIRLARNSGAHNATMCGLEHVRGDCAVLMAADLQDPPDMLPALLQKWQAGAQVVWATRARRHGEKASTLAFARLYYLLMRWFVGIKDMPATGADFFLVDRQVVRALREFNEQNVSIHALITWMGFRQATITYTKHARLHGHSGWSLEKKLKLAVDSVTSFTYLPIRLMSYLGFITAFAGFGYASLVVANALAGHPVHGWSSLMVVVLVFSGIQMLMMGVLGEYLWRALDESRRRPRYLVEELVNGAESKPERPWRGPTGAAHPDGSSQPDTPAHPRTPADGAGSKYPCAL
jgi:dolichol-phosphate mannosyltransferase